MRFKSLLGLSCGLMLASGLSAQTTAPTPAPAQQPAGTVQPPATNMYPPALYPRNDISKALNLTPQQINQLNDVTNTVQGQYSAQYGNLNALNDAERFARMQELNRQYYTDWNKRAAEIFNAEQQFRYQQLNYQYGVFNTFYDP